MLKASASSQKSTFSLHRISYIIIGAALLVMIALFVAPAFSTSSNPCSTCHAAKGYSQTLSVTFSQAPPTLTVGQTATINAKVKNTVLIATTNNVMSSVSATLKSLSGHFTVSTATVNAGSLASGRTASVSWQITAVSAGTDTFSVSASGINTHYSSYTFSDSVSASTSIVTASSPTPVPTSTPTPASSSTPTPTSSPTSPSPASTTPTTQSF